MIERTARPRMQHKPFWIMQQAFKTYVSMSYAMERDRTIGVANSGEVWTAEHNLRASHSWYSTLAKIREPGEIQAPPGFPRPFLSLPRQRFAPDFFEFGSYWLASRRLRDVLALPEHVVQYWPIELLAGTAEAEAQDYRWMRVLLCQHAMDWARSVCKVGIVTNTVTGRRSLMARGVERFAVRPGLRPVAELFWAAETRSRGALAADVLAERVLRAGCTGVAFQDPGTIGIYQGIKRFRTAKGVRERDDRPEAKPKRPSRPRAAPRSKQPPAPS